MKSVVLAAGMCVLVGCAGDKPSPQAAPANDRVTAIVPSGCTAVQGPESGIGLYNCTQTLAELKSFATEASKSWPELEVKDEKDGFHLISKNAAKKNGKFARFNTGQYVASPPGFPTPFRRDAKASGTCLSVVPEFAQ